MKLQSVTFHKSVSVGFTPVTAIRADASTEIYFEAGVVWIQHEKAGRIGVFTSNVAFFVPVVEEKQSKKGKSDEKAKQESAA